MDKCGNCMRLSECTYEFGAKADDPSCTGFREPLRIPYPEGPTMTDKTELEVTQRAREAYLSLSMLPEFDAIDVREGRWDKTTGLQAFARFERDILATRTPDPTPVAWAYTNEFWPLGSFPPSWTRVVKVHDGWTETPLYAHQTAVPADGLVEALCHIKDETQRRQLPLTSLINDIATQALAAYRGEA